MRVVIKIGTNVLIDSEGKLNQRRLEELAANINQARQEGYEVALISSGAVGMGRSVRPELGGGNKRKVLAAIGQPVLMQSYLRAFSKYGLTLGQCLLSRIDFSDHELYRNLVAILENFFQAKVIPIINENDVLAPASLNFGDNDSLAAMLAIAVKADLLMLLTDQPGLFNADPKLNRQAELISVVTRVDKEIERLCGKITSSLGQGGMISKVRAARQAVFAGITTFVADGREPAIISKILNGQLAGTRFIACASGKMSEQKRWLMAAKGFGQIVIDSGAANALRAGKSLLFPGIIVTKGLFEPGSIVEIISDGQIVSYGKSNYSDKELNAALSARKKKPTQAPKLEKEVVHCDYMAVLKA